MTMMTFLVDLLFAYALCGSLMFTIVGVNTERLFLAGLGALLWPLVTMVAMTIWWDDFIPQNADLRHRADSASPQPKDTTDEK